MSESFGLVVRFTLREGAEHAFDQLVSETVKKIRTNEPGTLIYATHRVDGQPQQRMFYELYRDRLAFDEHEAQPHVKRFLAERAQYTTGIEVDFLSTLATHGMPSPEVTQQ